MVSSPLPIRLSRYLVSGRMQDDLQTDVLPEPPEELTGTFLRRLGEGVGRFLRVASLGSEARTIAFRSGCHCRSLEDLEKD